MTVINMNEKQNNKFVLGSLYPEYFKQLKQPILRQEIIQPPKVVKSKEDRKIQSKLKTIIYNLQRQIEEKTILKKHKLDFGDMIHDTDRQSIPSRSISLKMLGNRENSHRYKTELQPSVTTDITQRNFPQKRFRKHSQPKQEARFSEKLILPKLKINSKYSDVLKKQLSKKKKLKRLEQLDEKQQELGKIVLQKVEKHFQIEKQGKRHYFQRVKEQQGIDESFLAYLRNKVKKADIALDR